MQDFNCLFVLGPTAVGKTAVGVRLALSLNGEILSADSRQVYKGLDIGSGKDLADYTVGHALLEKLNPSLAASVSGDYQLPYHIIDVTDLHSEYNLYDFQEDFYRSFADVTERGKLPVVVGGTGMYLDCILRNYDILPTPAQEELKKELEAKSYDELKALLIAEKEKLHNTTDFADKDRIIQALLIERWKKSDECAQYLKNRPARPVIKPLVFGTTFERSLVRKRIALRLRQRLDNGLVEEVEGLRTAGYSFERLEQLGLEYRFVSQYLKGEIPSREELFEKLNLAIGQFAKRQETWFRGMEKKGVKIHWLPESESVDERLQAALEILRA